MMNTVSFAFIVGAVPTVAMILASILFSNIEVGSLIEACFQNFAAGLILAAVASELFPVIMDAELLSCSIGVTSGFAIALSFIYGLEYMAEYLESLPDSGGTYEAVPSQKYERAISYPEGMDQEDLIDPGGIQLYSFSSPIWEDQNVDFASEAIRLDSHRDNIKQRLDELLGSVKSMEDRSEQLLERGNELSNSDTETITEKIDKEIHHLQYLLDHTRRLLQGSGVELTSATISRMQYSLNVSEDRKALMKKNLTTLKRSAEHLVEHINKPILDKQVLQEMHMYIDVMDKQTESFHEAVNSVSSGWLLKTTLPETHIGDKLPMNLVLPVILDCFVDGALIGISISISTKAGMILAFANSLEMSFLGMAYASRLLKCTGSSFLARNIALYVPPIIMFLSVGIGAVLGKTTEEYPILFIGLVAFGVVALLFLVCNELLIEANKAQGEKQQWWISIMVFLGVYIVIILDHII